MVKSMLALAVFSITLLAVSECRLGTRCLDDSACEPNTECCVVSSYLIKRGKCAPRLREGIRCSVGANRISSFWNLPYSCGCGYGTTCIEETWQDPKYPGVDLKRDRCRGSGSSGRPSSPTPPASSTPGRKTTLVF